MQEFKQHIINEIKKSTNIKTEINLEIPPSKDLGDFSFPCFTLAKDLKKSPIEIALDISKKITKNDFIERVEVKGPYLNFFINKDKLIELTLKKILKEKDKFGSASRKKDKVMIEFSQPNTHKEFHIGHLRNVALGDSLVRIYRFNGYKTIAANYIGDIGNHVAKCLWLYLKKYKGKEPKEKRGAWLGDLYTESTKLVDDNEVLKEEVQTLQKRLEEGDKKLVALWKKTRKWSLDEFNEIYKKLNINFDVVFYESEEEKPGKILVKSLLKRSIVELNEGAILINLEKYKLGVFLLLKRDGSSLYSTKDLALANTKFKRYKIDKSIYVVADEQKTYFQQLFKTLEIIGFKQAKNCYHLPYSLVMLESGKMSSREGNIIKFNDIYRDVLDYAMNETKKRHKDWNKLKQEKISNQIALSALKFSMIAQDNDKVIIFNKERALSFEGNSGPYVQYTYARSNSILKKVKSFKIKTKNTPTEEEFQLIKKMADFPEITQQSFKNYQPHIIANYCLELAQLLTEFYHKCKVIQEDKNLMNFRLTLIKSYQQVIKNATGLLGIELPDKM